MQLNAHVPAGPLATKWDQCRLEVKLVSPANRRKHHVLVVGSGLAGASAAATLGDLGYIVDYFCFQEDSPRRAHSIAAQGGINAAKNYCNDGDSVHRLFYDTMKGGDFRSREANVFLELAERMCFDALERRESCGAHFRVEHQTAEGEGQRDKANFAYMAAWEFTGEGTPPILHKGKLEFQEVHPSQRSYK